MGSMNANGFNELGALFKKRLFQNCLLHILKLDSFYGKKKAYLPEIFYLTISLVSISHDFKTKQNKPPQSIHILIDGCSRAVGHRLQFQGL